MKYVALALGAIWIVLSVVLLFLVCSAVVLSLGCTAPAERVGRSVEWLVTVAQVTPAPLVAPVDACPADMVEIRGYYCPFVTQVCLEGSADRRCARFAPSVCRGLRVPKHFCIDRYEYPNVAGQRPTSWMSWSSCKAAAAAIGKRLCSQEEWSMSCEGEGIQAYPYFPGLVRRNDVCNHDNKPPNVFLAKRKGDTMARQLDSLLVLSGSMPNCVSPFGVFDQVGNIDEFVVTPSGGVGMVGGHIFGIRNRCRAVTTAHGKNFTWYEGGCRFCGDVL